MLFSGRDLPFYQSIKLSGQNKKKLWKFSREDVEEITVYVAATQKGKVFSLESVIDCTRYNSVKRLFNVTCYVLQFKIITHLASQMYVLPGCK